MDYQLGKDLELFEATCVGLLLIHRDGQPAACTEELEGRCCPDPRAIHVGGVAGCEQVLGSGGCEQCSLEVWEEGDWRHAVHVGKLARTNRRCMAHRGVGAVGSSSAPRAFG